ncbi:MAG: hypothetical protein R3338_03605 [Thermoanaerobaculia bacterium]|nr:hypothetical protein [Thermoanaerobaculia bacterium]
MPGRKGSGRGTAGLIESVGRASFPTRLGISLAFVVTGLLVGGGGWAVSHAGGTAGRGIALLALLPFANVACVAALYAFAPHSAFGVWLDRNLPRIRDWRVALGVAVALLILSLIELRITEALSARVAG